MHFIWNWPRVGFFSNPNEKGKKISFLNQNLFHVYETGILMQICHFIFIWMLKTMRRDWLWLWRIFYKLNLMQSSFWQQNKHSKKKYFIFFCLLFVKEANEERGKLKSALLILYFGKLKLFCLLFKVLVKVFFRLD